MSWEKTTGEKLGQTIVTFYCDSPDCDVAGLFDVLPPGEKPLVSEFADCWKAAQEAGWRSFKRAGKPWDYFCPKCAADAEVAHRRYNQEEAERERIKERNAR
jgi:hypothetical protein